MTNWRKVSSFDLIVGMIEVNGSGSSSNVYVYALFYVVMQ